MSQTVGQTTTNFLWDEESANGDIIAETNASGAVQASYTTANGEVLAETQAGTTSYTLPDGQGSIRALTNSGGAITDTFRYDAFGNLLSHQGTTPSAYGYDGQRDDVATGLYALRARSYDPTTGRFLSADPATSNTNDPSQVDRYVFAGANPINQSDPSGMDLGEYAETLTTADIPAAEELPALSDPARVMLALFVWVVESATGEAIAPAEYAWVAWGAAALEQFAADVALARQLDNAIIYFINLWTSGSGGFPGSNNGTGDGSATSGAGSGSAGNPSVPRYLYHYTLASLVGSIFLTGLNASDPAAKKPGNAEFGPGQYFTDLGPIEAGTFSTPKLARALFNFQRYWGTQRRYDIVAIKVDVSGLPIIREHDLWSHTYDGFGHFGIFRNPTTSPLSLRGRSTYDDAHVFPVDFAE